MKTYTYTTDFNLAIEVEVNTANEYLNKDDMANYLRDDIEGQYCEFRNTTINPRDIIALSWHVSGYGTNNTGIITLKTFRALDAKELLQISLWVKGQNSDGLGESFEQQFATSDEDSWDLDMASFDWKTNKYIFHELKY